jgi:hypothetical protein
MLPDDPRHGTKSGYTNGGCRDKCCRRAAALAKNLWIMRRDANGGQPLHVSKVGSVRRLRALQRIGWTRRQLAAEAGFTSDYFAMLLLSNREKVDIDTHRLVCDLYDRLSMRPGPSTRSRAYAEKQGWPPPLAWPEDRIDDAGFELVDWEYREPTRAEQLDGLDERQAGITEVLCALGITREALDVWCRRHGRSDLYSRLVAREDAGTVYRNQHTKGAA